MLKVTWLVFLSGKEEDAEMQRSSLLLYFAGDLSNMSISLCIYLVIGLYHCLMVYIVSLKSFSSQI